MNATVSTTHAANVIVRKSRVDKEGYTESGYEVIVDGEIIGNVARNHEVTATYWGAWTGFGRGLGATYTPTSYYRDGYSRRGNRGLTGHSRRELVAQLVAQYEHNVATYGTVKRAAAARDAQSELNRQEMLRQRENPIAS
jgi:hypothetical protein